MNFSRFSRVAVVFNILFALAACGSPPTKVQVSTVSPATSLPAATVTIASITPDPCAKENVSKSVQDLHRFMRAFDDASAVASNTVRTQLGGPVGELQKIRRDAEDFQIPSCLEHMKQLQISHMNTTIDTLLAFMGGKDQGTTNQGIEDARELHDLYIMEMAHLLGITVVALPTTTPAPIVLSASETPRAVALNPTVDIPSGATFVTNTGPSTVNLRRSPSFVDSETLGMLLVGDKAIAIGRNNDGTWYLIEIPGQKGKVAWVFAKLVLLSTTPDVLPVATPTP